MDPPFTRIRERDERPIPSGHFAGLRRAAWAIAAFMRVIGAGAAGYRRGFRPKIGLVRFPPAVERLWMLCECCARSQNQPKNRANHADNPQVPVNRADSKAGHVASAAM